MILLLVIVAFLNLFYPFFCWPSDLVLAFSFAFYQERLQGLLLVCTWLMHSLNSLTQPLTRILLTLALEILASKSIAMAMAYVSLLSFFFFDPFFDLSRKVSCVCLFTGTPAISTMLAHKVRACLSGFLYVYIIWQDAQKAMECQDTTDEAI